MNTRAKYRKRPAQAGGSVVRQRLLAAFVILSALALGLLMPGITTAIQDMSIARLDDSVELGEGTLSLFSDDAKIEKFRRTLYMTTLDEYGYEADFTYGDQGKFMTAEDAKAKYGDIKTILEGTGFELEQIGDLLVNASETVSITENATHTTFDLLWAVDMFWGTDETVDKYGGVQLDFVVDDATGLVLAIHCMGPANYMYDMYSYSTPSYSAAVAKIAENMARLYGFTDTILIPAEPNELNPYRNTYYINFVQGRETVFRMPVTIESDCWSINIQP